MQWQVSTDGGATFSSITDGGVYSGAGTTTLNITAALASMNGEEFQAVFSNSASLIATTTAATLTVDLAPTVTTNPANQTISAGGTATFTAAASNGNPTPTLVQWQVSTDGGNTWANLSDGGNFGGSATTTLTVSAAYTSLNGNLFRAVFSANGTLSAASASAQLIVTSNNAYSAYIDSYYECVYAYSSYVETGNSYAYAAYANAWVAFYYAYYAEYYNSIGNQAGANVCAYYAYYYGAVSAYESSLVYVNTGNVNAYDSWYYGFYGSIDSYHVALGY